jgi:hypothetical protein
VTENAFGEIGPYLAASWEIDMDKAQVVFQLRKGIKFSDGSDFNADAAAWNIDRRIETGNWIKEFKDAEATGEYELTVHLNRWDNNVLGPLASRANIMISKENFENNGLDYANEHPVGTGPFVLKEKVSGYHVLFVKNENYWQEGLPYLDGIDYIELSDEMAQNAALQATGDEAIDVLTSRSISQLTTMTAGGTGIRLVQGFAGPVCLFPSSMDENSPLSKLEVRQAISYAIDRDTLCSALGPKFYTPALQLYPEPFKGVLPDSYNCTYDPDKAKELLTAAGYPDGINISFFVPPTMDKDAMSAGSKMLGDAGIQCDMQFPETALANDLNYKGWDNGVLASPSRAFSNITSTYYFDFDADYFFSLVSGARRSWGAVYPVPADKRGGRGNCLEDAPARHGEHADRPDIQHHGQLPDTGHRPRHGLRRVGPGYANHAGACLEGSGLIRAGAARRSALRSDTKTTTGGNGNGYYKRDLYGGYAYARPALCGQVPGKGRQTGVRGIDRHDERIRLLRQLPADAVSYGPLRCEYVHHPTLVLHDQRTQHGDRQKSSGQVRGPVQRREDPSKGAGRHQALEPEGLPRGN